MRKQAQGGIELSVPRTHTQYTLKVFTEFNCRIATKPVNLGSTLSVAPLYFLQLGLKVIKNKKGNFAVPVIKIHGNSTFKNIYYMLEVLENCLFS